MFADMVAQKDWGWDQPESVYPGKTSIAGTPTNAETSMLTQLENLKKWPHDRQKTASDGGSTDYYTLPAHATELRHLMSYKGMGASRANVFKACYRLDEKDGVDVMYDLNKMLFFVQDMIEAYQRGEKI